MDNDTAESWRREFSVLSDHFSFETKTAMKNKVFFKMRGKKKKNRALWKERTESNVHEIN